MKCMTHINDEHVDNTDNLNIVMPMYNLIEYSDTSESSRQFKKDEQNLNNGDPANVTTADSSSFKYKSSLTAKSTPVNNNRILQDVKIDVPLKYLGNFR